MKFLRAHCPEESKHCCKGTKGLGCSITAPLVLYATEWNITGVLFNKKLTETLWLKQMIYYSCICTKMSPPWECKLHYCPNNLLHLELEQEKPRSSVSQLCACWLWKLTHIKIRTIESTSGMSVCVCVSHLWGISIESQEVLLNLLNLPKRQLGCDSALNGHWSKCINQ